MIDLDKRCNIEKCWICEKFCTFYPHNAKKDFVLAKPDLIRWKLDSASFIKPSAKALMLDILKCYETGEIVGNEKEKEMKETKTYEQGLEEAWEIANNIAMREVSEGGYSISDMNEIFGEDRLECNDILMTMNIHAVKAKIDAWEAEKNKPKLGDVVVIDDIGEFLFLGESEYCYHVLDPNDDGVPRMFDKSYVCKIKKTGKHFDIQGMLDEIKGEYRA